MPPNAVQEGSLSHSEASSGRGAPDMFSGRRVTWLMGLLLFLLVAGVFLPALRHDFIYYDDPRFVTENPHVQGGLTWANVKWAFLTADVDYWRPLSWLSHMADCRVFGLDPWGHHLTSVLLHTLNALLVFVVLRKMTGAVWRSLLVAALFGLHPMHVESVAWIAERKDVLSTLFWLLTIWAYAHWVRQREARRRGSSAFYGLALVFFALGLMTKPMLVTVPCVLLLLDTWPLNRLARTSARSFAAAAGCLVAEKIPFFALAAAVGLVTFLAQKHIGALKTAAGYPWPGRIENALIAYSRYLGKCAFPGRLAVFYPYSLDHPVVPAVLAGVLLAGVTVAVCALCRRRPYLPVGWLWFVGTLVPVIGLVQVGEQSMADRYSYMPLVGVFIMLAWAAGDAAARGPRWLGLTAAAAGVILAACTALTSRQLGFWQNSTTLFRHALAVTDRNWAAHTYLGYALARSPANLPEAIAQYRMALQIDPELAVAHNYLGDALVKTPGGLPGAIIEFREALRLDPQLADAHSNLATALAGTPGSLPEAIAEYQTALRLRPDSAEMHDNLGLALGDVPGRLPEAIAEFRTAVQLEPDSAKMHFNLGRGLAETHDLPGAIAEYRAALQIKPGDPEAHYGLGLALADVPGSLSGAVAEYQAAMRLRPDDPKIHNALGNAWLDVPGRLPDAVSEFQTALRLQPDLVEVHNNLGIALSQLPGRLPEAIAEYETVLRAKPDFTEAHLNLGNALAMSPGRSGDAIAEYEAAIRLQPDCYQAHFALGFLLSGAPGRRPEAVGHLEAALRIKPDFEPARALLDRLRAAPP